MELARCWHETSRPVRELTRLPKVDLHVHLEGSIRASTLREIAQSSGSDVSSCLQGDRYIFRDATDFFNQYNLVRACLKTPGDFYRVAYEFCQDEAAQGVAYAEVTFTAEAHGPRLGDWDMPVMAVLEGFAAGETDFGVRCRLIFDHSRRKPVELAWRTLEVAHKHHYTGVTALGLSGPEGHPASPYVEVFRAARDAGLHSVPHAGEQSGPESIREALEYIGAERIGHGFRILEAPELLAQVSELGIPLEVCPSINVAMRFVPSIEAHPLPRLLKSGLVVTLNSDVPAMCSRLAAEYELARRIFGLDDIALAGLARAGIDSSFADDEFKAVLRRGIDNWLDE